MSDERVREDPPTAPDPPDAQQRGPTGPRLRLAAYLGHEPARRAVSDEATPTTDVIESVIDRIVAAHPPSWGGNLSGFLWDLDTVLERSENLARRRTTVAGKGPGERWRRDSDTRNMVAVEAEVTERVDSLQTLASELEGVWATCRYAYFHAASRRWGKEATVLRFVTVIDRDDFYVTGTIRVSGSHYPRLAGLFEQRFGRLPSSADPLAPTRDLGRWVRGLGRFGQEVVERAGIAAAWLALPIWQQEFPADGRPLQAIEAHEAWLACPCEMHGARLSSARSAAGLQQGAAAEPTASKAARAAALCSLRGEGQATRAASLLSDEIVREAIRRELLPWALGEDDPLQRRLRARGSRPE